MRPQNVEHFKIPSLGIELVTCVRGGIGSDELPGALHPNHD